MLQEIKTLDQIKLLVDAFYVKVREDELLGPIFERVIQDRWPEHLEKMYRFWQTILLEEHTYFGSPFGPHANLPVSKAHFDRWINLFHQTVDAHLTGEKAEDAKWRATKMAELFNSKIEYYRENLIKPII
ncbi:MAG: group III truncated hemoglobin [Saprospirales bacterium]|nr:group III truncated hemoglobin [Saprospirales bacterium]MBK8489679.1 group III truncated hemoglobin [Saprospirales bacterium]